MWLYSTLNVSDTRTCSKIWLKGWTGRTGLWLQLTIILIIDYPSFIFWIHFLDHCIDAVAEQNNLFFYIHSFSGFPPPNNYNQHCFRIRRMLIKDLVVLCQSLCRCIPLLSNNSVNTPPVPIGPCLGKIFEVILGFGSDQFHWRGWIFLGGGGLYWENKQLP